MMSLKRTHKKVKIMLVDIQYHIIQVMHSFEVNIRIFQPENSDVHRSEVD